MNGMEDSILHFINGKRHEIPDGTSRHGNIIIIGKKTLIKQDLRLIFLNHCMPMTNRGN